MWQTTHLFSGHGAFHLVPVLRAMHWPAMHALLTRLFSRAAMETLLLASATLLFVLACLGFILVTVSYAH
ncbi:hypothetical protein [Dyella mobilis]|uniref:Uncharacterized protein n=1 Tax=Dyella mobilis TaxID=1849582 RepID=A0ABS2KJE5_9GAMM|nr:hypothetical protein [Dyella mobilis]MBM7131289.1 hypothetical protein [Dyella mobilis]GLQ98774.1 hypothetical protein GCM10007863_31940 [Dyella mobilis]